MPMLDLSPDELLTTTRAVRKRLDLSRPVEMEVIRECLEIALQAPAGGNLQTWHFMVVTDAAKRAKLAEIYNRAFDEYRAMPHYAGKKFQDNAMRGRQQAKMADSAEYLAAHLHEIPVHVIPCMAGRTEGVQTVWAATMWASLYPAVWNFMLAARARGLGTSLTTVHLMFEKEAADVLGIPFDKITQGALIPMAYTKGTDFKAAKRQPLDDVLHINDWGSQ